MAYGGETYLEVSGCLGAAWMDLPGGVMDFSTVDAFEMVLETVLILVLVNFNGAGGGGGAGALRGPIDSNRSTFGIVLAALETFRHMLDFKSSVSCFGFG